MSDEAPLMLSLLVYLDSQGPAFRAVAVITDQWPMFSARMIAALALMMLPMRQSTPTKSRVICEEEDAGAARVGE